MSTVSEKKNVSDEESLDQRQKEDKKMTKNSKRQRKSADPYRSVTPTSFNASVRTNSVKTKGKKTFNCKNLACQAILRREDAFCKRCSCCICLKYDGNKDPSLWLTCNSDPPFPGESCGFSCHLECAFKSDKSGLKESNRSNDLDGCFCCVSCGKTNSVLECWRKQLMTAMETSRVYELCRRLVLAQKLLKGTEKYIKQSETVEEAVTILQKELKDSLTGLPSAKCKGIIDRLRSAQEVKILCSSALKSLQETLLDDHALPSKMQGSTSADETKETTKIPQGDEEATFVNCLSTKEEEKQLVNGENSSYCGFGLENCVKIIRELECSGYVDQNFRLEFLTWYSLRATDREIFVVNTFIQTLKNVPMALAGQLIHTFSECISKERSAIEGDDGNSAAFRPYKKPPH